MRDEILPKFQADFDELAEALICETNKIHSQGVGLASFSAIDATYKASAAGASLDSSGLHFEDEISSGQFSFWVYDSNGNVVDLDPGDPTKEELVVTIDPTSTSVNDIRNALNGLDGGNITASVTSDGQLLISGSNGRTFAFSNDTSYVLAALGMNTFFTGTDASTLAVNSALDSQKQFIAAGKVDADGGIAAGDNTNALDVANLQYQGVTIQRWTYDRGSSPTSVDLTNTTIDTYLHAFEGDIGIKSQSIERELNYNAVVVNQIQEVRDSISAVSLDEEMTSLMKYQHAYAVAAKLVSTADEMLNVLLETR
ncbi:MAG: hypothetical protein JRJ85_19610 [Deltaproteobacteria bacterium]|nr:hypothetical protein [Deltaproteobacteria bacterium]